MTSRVVIQWIGFQLVWLVSALGAANGRSAPAMVAAAIFILAVLASKRRPFMPDMLTIAASGLVGLVCESLMVISGLVHYSTPWPSVLLAPTWVIAIWLAFGATVFTLVSALGQWPLIKGSVAGLIAGPLAYWAGDRLGALEIGGPPQFTYLLIGIVWAVAMPVLIACDLRAERSV